jgi:hypothetical protein
LLPEDDEGVTFVTMRATLIFLFDCAALLVLLNSFVRFAHAGFTAERAVGARVLAAGSSLVTLLVAAAIYADAFRRAAMDASRTWFGDSPFTVGLHDAIAPADRFVRDAVNAVNPGNDVVYTPHPALWPIVLIAVAYVVRGLMYLTLERKDLKHAAVTGATYWSHITGYAMIVAFLVEIVGWNAFAVVAVSLLILAACVVGLAGVFEDAGVVFRAVLRVAAHYLHGVSEKLARLGASIAAAIRIFFRRAHRLYLDHVRAPIRRRTSSAIAAAERFDRQAAEELKRENERHRQQFPEDDEAPETGFVTH